MKLKQNKAITLIALILTIIILLIIAGVGIKTIFGEQGLIEQSIRGKFLNNYYQVKELAEIYKYGKEIESVAEKTEQENKEQTQQVRTISNSSEITMKLPITTKLTETEIKEIKNNNRTLAETIKKFSKVKDISTANLYWINLELIGANVPNRYLIDIVNEQIYDYEGEYFYQKRWHVPELGVDESTLEIEYIDPENEMWDGWITLTLYYPRESTERMWRLSEEGEVRTDQNLEWQEYTGPITVRISQIEDIWIKYKLDGEEVIIPPQGKLLVDIQASYIAPDKAKININYDKYAETKQYKINGGEWQDYEGEFIVTENILIEAKGTKTENIYDADGNIVGTQLITGTDAYFVRKIPDNDSTTVVSTISAPTIQRLDATQQGEVAKVKIIYPDTAIEKIYKLNYGEKQNYTEEISIEKYGTVVTAYYKTTEGTSLYAYLYIDEPNKQKPIIYEPYPPNPPVTPTPTYVLEGPTINISSTGEQATITVTTAKPARKIYIKLGNQSYQEYTESVIVNTNMTVKAYYISAEEGRTSKTSYAEVSGLSQGGRPSVVIDAEPYPYGNSKIVDEVTVTITTNGTNLEYSYDDIAYTAYSIPLKITKNCRIYARAKNDNGTTVEYLDITNLENTPPAKKDKLSVNITVTPEPALTNQLVDKVKVEISYDQKATQKYYTIGKYGERKEYTGPFEITSNCTIYAYAISENGNGKTYKMIDNITTGIAQPIIEGDPGNSQGTTKTKISIKYDNNAKTKRYEIDGDGLRDYTGEFEVTKNCTIRAVNTNSLGHTSEALYTVENVTPPVTPIILDKGDYYLIKLPYPGQSKLREYKYKEDGTWKPYKEDGILFIKPEKKDKVLSNDKIIIQIEDENGNKIDFNGDWYILDLPISEAILKLYMKWDYEQLAMPTIVPNTTEATNEVTISIIYPSLVVNKQYKIVYPDGTNTGWKTYKQPFKINQKGTLVYARGQDETSAYSQEAIYKINNIDEEPPVIKLTADLENAQQQVGVKVMVTDDTEVSSVKWAKGNLGESYFTSSGTVILNNSIVNITENGIYTFYAIDKVGNTQIYTLTIGNVDTTPPQIKIEATPEAVGLESTITIDYGDSATKLYKIGENSTTWNTYTDTFTITSYDVIAANAVNDDYTVTIYAKGIDSVGNEIIESKKILNLDLDAPALPIINSSYGYPILTEYGVIFDGATTIVYDNRDDITNYYSLDNGITWQTYTGTFNIPGSGTIIAKSVKTSGLEIIATVTINIPANAMPATVFDGNITTGIKNNGGNFKTGRIDVDKSIWGQKIKIYIDWGWNNAQVYVNCYDVNGTNVGAVAYGYDDTVGIGWKEIKIPENTRTIVIGYGFNGAAIYELEVKNEPLINVSNYYPTITSHGIEQGYNIVNINYFQTSAQRLYKINNGEWKTYTREIKLKLGDVIYAKGIDKNGKETNIITSYTSVLPSDAMPITVYDGNITTGIKNDGGNFKTGRIDVDKSIWGQKIKIYIDWHWNNAQVYVNCYDVNGTNVGAVAYGYDDTAGIGWKEIKIPENTRTIVIGYGFNGAAIYEIQPLN